MKISYNKKFHGTTVVSGKGQVVIPASVRKSLGIKTGEKLLVFELNDHTVALSKLEAVEKFAEHLTSKLKSLKLNK